MKYSIIRLFVILAIVMSFVAVQGVWAQEDSFELTGTIGSYVIGPPNYIVFNVDLESYDIYGVNYTKLDNCKGIDPEEVLTIEGIIVILNSGEERYIGCSVSQDEKYLDLNNRYCQ